MARETKRPYRKIEVGTWISPSFRALSAPVPNAQTLWLYLLTGTRTTALPGVVVAREATLSDDLRWDLHAFRDAFREVMREGMAEANWDAGVVVLSHALFDESDAPRETSRPASLNVIKAWAKAFEQVPDCSLKYEYLHQLKAFCDAMPEAFRDAFAEAFRDAFAKASRMASGIQKKKQDQKQERSPRAHAHDPSTPVLGTSTGQSARSLAEGSIARAPLGEDPAVVARRKLGDLAWDRLNHLRQVIGAEIGVQALPLPVHDPGRKELAERLLECGDLAKDYVVHVVDTLEREARETRSIEWLAGKSFGKKAWGNLVSKPKPVADPPTKPARSLNPQPTAADEERARLLLEQWDREDAEAAADAKPPQAARSAENGAFFARMRKIAGDGGPA